MTEKDDLEKIKTRIKKLLAMADSTSPNEAAIAAKRAASLMDKYQLEKADIIKHKLKEGDDIIGEAIIDLEYKRWPQWLQSLSIYVADAFDCQVKFIVSDGGKYIRVEGYELDVRMCQWVYGYLYQELDRLANNYVSAHAKQTLTHYATLRTSFLSGAAFEVKTRLIEMKREREQSEVGQSLVVVKKDAINKKFGESNYGSSYRRTHMDSNAYVSGMVAGRNVNLKRPLEKSKNSGEITS